ncbi:TSUP family transporter [Campylobacter sp. RM12640]|uniref:TSUP family transporter n=1 Tax=unclassified Campylobacter TaxID=2593542 RepID=UPI001BDAF8FF|nr:MULTISPECIES: TSUP family transporter [unclassified Campylobacter]MBZ7977614.1 TSUP family transporter [Campylobacter sp. RM12654]MBZ7981239.1 TSUP family transporter [Campylobacter sp. RM12640]MBZ7988965.1 TSUP family transporter [Campylobacter sp. RM12635]MBT0883409.1 TSUP family transporter [Campylobacter sp. 2018MI13]ULO03206.1 sulfite exporter TauE/SafE family protein [Campylobacter sp. RM12651]
MEFSLLEYFIGFLASFIGGFIDAIVGGGGLVTLPVILGLGVPPSLAIATSKLQASMAAVSAVFSLRKEIKFKELRLGILITAIFSILGSYVLLLISNEAIMPLILVILILVFIYTIFKPNLGNINKKAILSTTLFLIIFGVILGFYDGFIGPGTGSFWILAFTSLLGFNLKQASINTKLLNTTSNVCSLCFFLCFYDVLIKLGLIMGVGGIIGAYLGGKCLLKININIIRWVFIIIVFCTICKLIYSNFF